jgi:hypothetical protein
MLTMTCTVDTARRFAELNDNPHMILTADRRVYVVGEAYYLFADADGRNGTTLVMTHRDMDEIDPDWRDISLPVFAALITDLIRDLY